MDENEFEDRRKKAMLSLRGKYDPRTVAAELCRLGEEDDDVVPTIEDAREICNQGLIPPLVANIGVELSAC